jgi:hypothetical protein
MTSTTPISAVHGNSSTSPGRDFVLVTPDNNAPLPDGPCRALRCIVPGALAGRTAAGKDRATTLFAEGEMLYCGFSHVFNTGTTATVEAFY